MQNLKRSNHKISDRKVKFLIYRTMIIFNTTRQTMTSQHPIQYFRCAIQLHVSVVPQYGIHIAHMIAVIMSKTYTPYTIH